METKFNFTQKKLETLPVPTQGRCEYRDAKMPGLRIRVTAKGIKTACIYKKVHGRPIRHTLGRFPDDLPTVATMRDAAREVLTKIAQGEDVQAQRQAKRREPTFQDLFAYWMEYSRNHKKTWREDERTFKKFLEPWAPRRLSAIRRAEIEKLHARVRQQNGKYAANRLLALIKAMFNKGVEAEYLGKNPATGIKAFKEESRDRFLQADELERFFHALDQESSDTLRDFFLIALLTGARRGNIQTMRWEDVDLDARRWRIPLTKTGKPMIVPLVERAVRILQRRLETSDESPWVFPSPRSRTGHLVEPKSAWKRIITRAELQDVRMHDLRRTLGSWQVNTGASLPVVGKTLGHTQPKTTQIYARLQLDPVRHAVETATDAMFAAGGQKLTVSKDQ